MSATVSPHVLAENPPSQFWRWRGYDIHYVQAGTSQGKPPLLLVHGFGASTDHWRKNITVLQGDFSVWAIDLLGFGRSPKAPVVYSGALWRDQLRDFINEVIGEPVVLAGNSLGGYASLCAAAQCPEVAKGLILLNSAGPFSDQVKAQPSPWKKALRKVLFSPLSTQLIFQYTKRRATIRKTLQKVYVNQGAVTERLIDEIQRPSNDPGAAKVFAAVFNTPEGAKVDHLLEALDRPLLMIWGEKDPWIRARERGAKFKQHCPNLTEHYLESGHCPHDDTPELVNPLIRDWLNQTF
ncbi:alpha/beta fold hydrolase [Picosynechococcus sp. NKBG042902]|uniref:alpha/beta fold hydrolase n=1 Tax=Picosynechococcus sp. NKBG042902 TaxID=490193 RepID=UPI0004AA2D2E|nr:alpha/beta fold hydrolase [Picosynechococcus sp. NKBG042902]